MSRSLCEDGALSRGPHPNAGPRDPGRDELRVLPACQTRMRSAAAANAAGEMLRRPRPVQAGKPLGPARPRAPRAFGSTRTLWLSCWTIQTSLLPMLPMLSIGACMPAEVARFPALVSGERLADRGYCHGYHHWCFHWRRNEPAPGRRKGEAHRLAAHPQSSVLRETALEDFSPAQRTSSNLQPLLKQVATL